MGDSGKEFTVPATMKPARSETNKMEPPVDFITIAKKISSAFIVSFTANLFWCQQFDLRQIRILRRNRLFLVTMIRLLHVSTEKKFQRFSHPSIPIDIFKNQYVLVFKLASITFLTEISEHWEIVGRTTESVTSLFFEKVHRFHWKPSKGVCSWHAGRHGGKSWTD